MKLKTFSQQITTLSQQIAVLHASGADPSDLSVPGALASLEEALEELRAAEDELRQQNAQLADSQDTLEAARQHWHALFDLAPDGYLVTDLKGRIMDANQAAAKMFRMDPEELVGLPLVVFVPVERRQEFLARVLELTRQRGRQEWEMDLLPHHTLQFPATVSVVVIRQEQAAGAAHNERTELAWLIHDISEHKRLEHELRSARDELELRVQERTAQLNKANAALRQSADVLENQGEQIQRSQVQFRALSRRLVELLEHERSYVADRLYNEAGQALAALKLQLTLLERSSGSGTSGSESIAEIHETLDRVMGEMHLVASSLRPAVLDQLGLVPALKQELEEFAEAHGVQGRFVATGLERTRVPVEVETAIYRIVQDGLRNVAQHAQATSVGLAITRPDGYLVVALEDDGVGFDPDLAEHDGALGLVGMRERAEAVGGRLTVESGTGAGTTIIAQVPIKHAA